MRTFIMLLGFACAAPLMAQSPQADPVHGYWRGTVITLFKPDGTIASVDGSGAQLKESAKGKWSLSASDRNLRNYELAWDNGKSEIVQMTPPYERLVLGGGGGPGVYAEKVKHLNVLFWSNALAEISWPGGGVKTEDFPQHLNLHLFVRKGDILGISLRNLHGKVSFALQGTCDGKEILKPADFRYTKRFDARWLQTADLTGYEVPATATAKGIRLGAKQDVSVAQARQGDIDTRALHYKYVFR